MYLILINPQALCKKLQSKSLSSQKSCEWNLKSTDGCREVEKKGPSALASVGHRLTQRAHFPPAHTRAQGRSWDNNRAFLTRREVSPVHKGTAWSYLCEPIWTTAGTGDRQGSEDLNHHPWEELEEQDAATVCSATWGHQELRVPMAACPMCKIPNLLETPGTSMCKVWTAIGISKCLVIF